VTAPERLVLAVDGGGTKTDVALIGVDGTLLARRIGPHAVPQVLGVTASLDVVLGLAAAACAQAGVGPAAVRRPAGTVLHLAGIDLPVEQTTYLEAARSRIAGPVVVDNDALAVLHAGVHEGYGVAVTCGTGANVVAGRRDGVLGRYRALGDITGDRAGGYMLGRAALGHAVRAADGRGPRTALEQLVSAAFDLPAPVDVADALHLGHLPSAAVSGLAPVVMTAARAHDRVACRLLDDLADELAVMVTALVRRVPPDGDRDLPVILGGGLLQAGDDRVATRLTGALERALPRAVVRRLDRPPVAGSGQVALRLVDAPSAAHAMFDRVVWSAAG
jgi:N-acetylglucosamine kinase-like BadF-type ATPase